MSLRNVLYLLVSFSCAAVILLSAFSLFYITPSYSGLIIENAKSEAIMIGNNLSSRMLLPQELLNRSLPPNFPELATQAEKDFNLMKIKVFTADGETIFSTATEDIGVMNHNEYFEKIVAKGTALSKLAKKNSKTMEGQLVSIDVVETYVPIMHEGAFAGAFEVYLDITPQKKRLDSLLLKSNFLLLTIVTGLMIVLAIVFWAARKTFIRQEEAELTIIEQKLLLQEKNVEFSILYEASRALATSSDMKIFLPRVLRTIIDRLTILKVERKGGIFILRDKQLELVTHLGFSDEFLALHENMTINDCLCGLAVRTGEIISSQDSDDDSRHTIRSHDMTPHGHIIIPLTSINKVIGALCLYLPVNTNLAEHQKKLLQSIGNQIGIAIDNCRRYDGRNKA